MLLCCIVFCGGGSGIMFWCVILVGCCICLCGVCVVW